VLIENALISSMVADDHLLDKKEGYFMTKIKVLTEHIIKETDSIHAEFFMIDLCPHVP
jgi:hypothetical protein